HLVPQREAQQLVQLRLWAAAEAQVDLEIRDRVTWPVDRPDGLEDLRGRVGGDAVADGDDGLRPAQPAGDAHRLRERRQERFGARAELLRVLHRALLDAALVRGGPVELVRRPHALVEKAEKLPDLPTQVEPPLRVAGP